MDPRRLVTTIVISSIVLLVVLCIVYVAMTKTQALNDRRQRRLTGAVEPHVRILEQPSMSVVIGGKFDQRHTFISTLGSIFGFDQAHEALYPVKWWVALVGTLVLSKVMEMIVADFLGAIGNLLVPVLWVLLSRNFFLFFVHRRQQQLLEEFPDTLSMLVRAIRVGIPVLEAMRNVSQGGTPHSAAEFSIMMDQLAIGVPMDEALQSLAQRSGLPEYRFFAATLTLQTQTGGTLSDTLESLADVIRKRAALRDKGHAMTSEARSSAMVLAVMPFLTGGIMWLVNPKYFTIMISEPTGKSMLGLAAILLIIGLTSIHLIIKNALR